jgi:hypothetical protein
MMFAGINLNRGQKFALAVAKTAAKPGLLYSGMSGWF